MVDERQAALEDIRHKFNPRFYVGQGITASLRLEHFCDEIIVTEPEANGFKSDGSLLCFSSVHKSQLDYVLLGCQLIQYGYPPPRYIAGRNLFIPNITRDYLKKLGAISLDRERVMRRDRVYIKAFSEYLRDFVLGTGEHLLFFPEGGRSYSGAVGKPATGIYDTILEVAPRRDQPVRIVPVTLTYDGVVEAASFHLLERTRNIKRMWQKKLAYYLVDMGQILLQYFRNKKVCGTVYIDVLPPIDVDDYVGDRRAKVRLAKHVHARQRAAVRMTGRSLLAEAMGEVERMPRTELTARVTDLLDAIRESDLPVTRKVAAFLPTDVDRERIVRYLLSLPGRPAEEDNGAVAVRRPAALWYCRTTTEPHFTPATGA